MSTVNRLKKGSRKQPQQTTQQQAQELTPLGLRSMSSIGSSSSIPDGSTPQYNESSHTAKQQKQYEQYRAYAACNPIGVTMTSAVFPHNYAMSINMNIPVGMFMSPMVALENENCEVMQKTLDKVPRCATCNCYMNCYNQIVKNKFNCFFCNRETIADKKYFEQPDRRELDSSIYQCLSPPNFYAKEPTEECFIFLVDITKESSNCKMLYYLVAALKEVLARPELDDLCVCFLTFDETLHYYDFSGEEVKCTIIDQSIPGEMNANKFEPAYLKDVRDKLFQLLDVLEEISQNNTRTGYNFRQPCKQVFQIFKHMGPKFFIFQTSQDIINDEYFKEKPTQPQINSQPGVSNTRSGSFYESRNKLFFDDIAQKALNSGCAFSFYGFARGHKNYKNICDALKITGSELKVYAKDTPVDLERFYYEFSYLLGATYFKEVRIEFLSSVGWHYLGVYGNAYKMKECPGIFFQLNWAEPSRKFLLLISPSQKRTASPFCGIQACIHYRYKRQSYATVVSIVQPVTGYIGKFYEGIDGSATSSIIIKKMMSALRLQTIAVIRKKIVKQLSLIYTNALTYYKKPESIPASVITIIVTGLAVLKSAHTSPETYLNSPAFDKLVEQRNVLQFSGMSEMGPLYNPYLFDLSDLDPGVCHIQQGSQFAYPPTIQPYFHHIKQGLFLLDNGLELYLFIAKQCDPSLLTDVFGKAKLTKHDVISQETIMEQASNRASQILNLIKVLREQKMYGWQPLFIVRSRENTLREKRFYMNFYREKYDQFPNFKVNLEEFLAILTKPNFI